MATANMTVSLDPAIIAMAKAQAAAHGTTASAWVARLIRNAALAEASRRYDEVNRAAPDRDAMAAWDAQQRADQERRWAGAEW
jgi:hypothetical protein